jgi:outer membrane translocation and assembly module TamA
MLLAVWAATLGAATAAAAPAHWEALRGRPIAEVRIVAREVFDPEQPEESHFLFAWANALHVRTRSEVIRREMLQHEGQPFDPERIAESERNLRALGLFQDVLVDVEAQADEVLVSVHTADRWSTKLRTDLSHRGGISRLELGVENTNLLGTGIQAGAAVVSSTDLDASSASWHDPRLFGSRWDAAYGLDADELMRRHHAAVERPFFSEDVRWTTGLEFESRRGEERLFEAGDEVERMRVRQETWEGFAAVHRPQPGLSRWALFTARRRLGGSDADEVALVALGWARLQRRFQRRQDLDLSGVGEDIASGWMLQAAAGADLQALGARDDRPFWHLSAGWARFLGPDLLLGGSLRQHAFVGDGGVENGRLNAELFGFWQKAGTLVWRAGGLALIEEPRSLRYSLGGDDVLRGYEARHLTGTRALYLNVEERLFSPWRILFLRLGGVVFVDAAAAWDAGERLDRSAARLAGGVGLRISNNKSGSGLVGVDVGFGTNSVQISVASGSFFRVARSLTYAPLRVFD